MKKLLVIVVLLFNVKLFAHQIIVDGDPADWIGANIGLNDTAYVDAGEAIWLDARGDDVGDGGDAQGAPDNPAGYTYPTDTTFTGGEADIIQGRLTADAPYLYFLIQLDTFASNYYPMVVIMMDVDGVRGSGNVWVPQNADCQVDSQIAWDYAVVIGDNGIKVFNTAWQDIADDVEAQVVYNPNGGYIEASLNAVKLDSVLLDTVVTYVMVAGLNEFGNFKEVDDTATQWHGGGGLGENGQTDSIFWIEPDIYDLAFVKSDDQVNDLNNYVANDTTVQPAIIRPTSSVSIPMYWITTGIKESKQLGRDRSLPVLFATKGIVNFGYRATLVTLYTKDGARVAEYTNTDRIDLSAFKYSVMFAVVKTDQGNRVYRIVNSR